MSLAIKAKELREQRGRLEAESKTLVAKAEVEKRDLTTEEFNRFEALMAQDDSLCTEIAQVEQKIRSNDLDQPHNNGINRQNAAASGVGDAFDEGGWNSNRGDDPMILIDKNGNRVRAARKGESFAKAAGVENTPEPLSLGHTIIGMASGNWEGAKREMKNLAEFPGSAGGFMLPSHLSGIFIDLARNKSAVVNAGALTIPMDGPEMTVARLDGDPTAAWRGEGEQIPKSDLTVGAYKLMARSLATIVPITLELWEDASNVAAVVENAVTQALALELDRAALRGQFSGDMGEIQGLRMAENVNERTAVGSPTYDDIADGIFDVEGNNGSPNAWLMSPREANTYRKLKDSNGLYLQPPEDVKNLSRFATNQIPIDLGAGSESEMYVGDFTQMWIGLRNNIRIHVAQTGRTTDTGSGDAFEEMKILVRAYLRADVLVARPTHFTRLLGVT